MAKTGQCANCKREVTIYGAGLCSVCFRAGKGLKGEEKEAALIGIQKKIERGDIHAGGRKSPAVKSAPVGRKRPCANCGRSQTIVGGGCCWACYRAARGLEGEEKAAALAAVKAKIEGGGLRRGGGRKGPRTPAPKGTVKVDGDITPHRAPITVRIPVISLDFADRRDLKIYDALLDQARRLRRTPEQQILWMLQNVLEQEAGLLAEASTQSG